MKRTAITLALLAVAATGLFAEKFVPATGSMIAIEGTSTLHAWKMEGTTINGQISVAPAIAKALNADAWKAAGDEVAAVAVTIPVTSIKSEHDKMDRLMADALKAKANPEIRYQMTSATLQEAAGATFVLKTTGKLTIAGVTRDLAMTVGGTRTGDGRYVLAGQAPIKMTEFGIKPPKAMMNTIRTGDDVKVTFRWVVAATN
ncbi:MAG TPA: YceI family protein [Thermoanaerobaculia bacterium]|nr:YceI family protein [Thermoanaerobaculia bacterium]